MSRSAMTVSPGGFRPVARVLRNGFVESEHHGAVAVVTPAGELVAAVGDANAATFLRSAAKPFQILPLLALGGVERFGLERADLALICASHGGTPEHVERARSLLARGGFGPEHLLCGPHPPLDGAFAQAMLLRGEEATPLHNNCSGKHAGMLLACRILEAPIGDYIAPGHPLQRAVLAALDEIAALGGAPIDLAVDGCSVPTFRLSLAAAARAYAALASPAEAGAGGAEAAGAEIARWAPHLETVFRAMTSVPLMVAGAGRFTTRLMEVTAGRVLGKEGHEGFYGLAVRAPVALGVALKIADGGERARDGVVLDLLRQLGALSAAELEQLRSYHRVERHNCRDLVIGEIVPDVELEQVGDGGIRG